MIILKDESDFLIADLGQLLFLCFMDRDAVQLIRAAVHAADNIHQRRFAGAGRPRDCSEFPLIDRKINVFEDIQLPR